MEILGLVGTVAFGVLSIWLWVKGDRKQATSDKKIDDLTKKQDDLIDFVVQVMDKEEIGPDSIRPEIDSLGAKTGRYEVRGRSVKFTVNANQAKVIRGVIKQTLPGVRMKAEGKHVPPNSAEGKAEE